MIHILLTVQNAQNATSTKTQIGTSIITNFHVLIVSIFNDGTLKRQIRIGMRNIVMKNAKKCTVM